MKRRRRNLLLGLSLALLAVGVVGLLLWPTPSEAEWVAALLHEGMTREQVLEVISEGHRGYIAGLYDYWDCSDGSILRVYYDRSPDRVFYVINISADPPPPEPPMIRLRRTLARVLPFLEE
jgi:hypothetical protein